MRKLRRSWLLAVHRWLFYLAVLVVIGSALSRIDGSPRNARIAEAGERSSNGASGADGDDRDERRGPPFMAFAGCR